MLEMVPELFRNTSENAKEEDWGTSGRKIVQEQDNGISKCETLHFWKCSEMQDRRQN